MDTNIVQDTADFINELFHRRLSSTLTYHNTEHTIDVVDNSIAIGKEHRCSPAELDMLAIAAWFHDAGYVEVYAGHEEKSIGIACEFLMKNHYPPDRIAVVTGCIQATKMPQSPKTLLEKIVCDADLINFGKENFFVRNEAIRKEWELALGIMFSDQEWLQKSIALLTNHRFHTDYAEQQFSPCRKRHLSTLKAMAASAISIPRP
jgi:predicted metal-dependent HD superfamily phosphohydrolase